MEEGATALLDWLAVEVNAVECFICDSEGLALVNRNAQLEHLAICAVLIRSLEEVEAITGEAGGALSVRLRSGQVLSCVVESTELGKLAIGWLRPETAAEQPFDDVAAALRKTFSRKEYEE